MTQKELLEIIEKAKRDKVTELDLSGKGLSTLPAEVGQLTNLEKLSLYENDLSTLPAEIGQLTSLKELDLGSNQLSDISPLKDLKNLTKLYLESNPIEGLPPWITDFNMKIQWKENASTEEDGYITFFDNPLKRPSVEIVKQGKEAIRNYFKSLQGKKKIQLKELKVLLVGAPMAGKTSLLKQLQDLDFDTDESQTHGVNIVTLSIQECRTHFWDFGGQEIMHASHQFFLSERSLYILVLDSRTDSKKVHWLKHVEKFGGDSPLIVVMNKIDDNPNYNIEQKRINDNFPQIKNRFHRISCKSKEGIAELKKCIAAVIPETSLFGSYLSIDWLNIKDKLVEETKANRYISRQRFVEICQEGNVADQSSQQTLLQYLHDLGIVLYFKQLNLANIYVLDPHWVTIGVYKIINSEKVKEGILKEEDLDYILNREDIKKDKYDPAKEKKIGYTPEEQRYIISIMIQFELCYQYDKRKNQYIIPDLLPKEVADEAELIEGTALSFVMKYDYLPTSIISRLMLRVKNDIVAGQQWRYGMLLDNKESGCKAKVKSDEHNKSISITVQGDYLRKQRYFSAIRYMIIDINKDFKNMEVEEFIPLPGYPDKLVEYQELLGYEKAGRDEYFYGKLGKSFSVSKMLDSIASKEDRFKEEIMRDKRDVTMHFHAPVGTAVGHSEFINEIINNVNSANASDDLKDLLKKLAEAVDQIIPQLSQELSEQVANDLQALTKEATSTKPRRKWYELSGEGLVDAAKSVGGLGKPVLETLKLLSPFFS